MDEEQKQAEFVFGALEALWAALVEPRGMPREDYHCALLAFATNLAHELGQTEPEFVANCQEAAAEEWATPARTEAREARADQPQRLPRRLPDRLDAEQRCRALGDQLKAELQPRGQGFVLVTFDHGKGVGAAEASNMAYISTLARPNAARLLTELVDHWIDKDGLDVEPSVKTATLLRELVSQLGPEDLQGVTAHQGRVRREGRRAEQLAAHLEAAAQHLALFEREQRQLMNRMRQEGQN